jgi:phosphoglycerol transferase MdoB-like AlkP superfamily enzyme
MQHIKTVLKLFLLLLLIYSLLRITFALVYFRLSDYSFTEILTIFYWGIRMDIAALFYINIIFFIYYFLIGPRFSVFLFSLINLPFIALNFIDLVYFRYNLRRSTIDIFYAFEGSVHSFGALFKQYWYILLIFLIVAVLFVLLVKRIIQQQKEETSSRSLALFASLAFIGVLFVLARGWDRRPLVPSTAILHVDPVSQPLVNNSTLNLLYSGLRSSSRLERKHYFSEQQLDSIYTIRREYKQEKDFARMAPGFPGQKRNVVIFVLESFSADFLTGTTDKAQTPFFDSLLNHSTVCTNAYANGHESVKGLTAILGSIPPFTEEPFYLSSYNSVPFNGIGTLLKKEGYRTSFFHGAEYDHFNFAKLCRMVGIDQYYSKDSYAHPEHDDGNWGVYDEYFFSYFADVMAEQQQPFFSVLFNTSSHPPFAIPAPQQKRFSIPGQRTQLNSVTYVDHSFRQLFQKIRLQLWFSNTIFVFCADHTLLEQVDRRSYFYQAYHIPLFIYDPQQPVGKVITRITQQLDIVPAILNKLGYSKPFMSFGKDFLSDSTGGFSIAKKNDGYQLIDSSTITCFNEESEKMLYYYNYRSDSALTKNLPGTGNTDLIKAIIQRFNNSLIDQKLIPNP